MRQANIDPKQSGIPLNLLYEYSNLANCAFLLLICYSAVCAWCYKSLPTSYISVSLSDGFYTVTVIRVQRYYSQTRGGFYVCEYIKNKRRKNGHIDCVDNDDKDLCQIDFV